MKLGLDFGWRDGEVPNFGPEIRFATVILVAIILMATIVSADTIAVGPGGKIQSAIDSAAEGDVIIIKSGTYRENLNVPGGLTLRGDDIGSGKPLIDAGGNEIGIRLNSGYATVQGLGVTNARIGIEVASNNNTIIDCEVRDSWTGIAVISSSNNLLKGNIVRDCWRGIHLKKSAENIVSSNDVRDNRWSGIVLETSKNNTVTDNLIRGNYRGFELTNSDENFYNRNELLDNNYNDEPHSEYPGTLEDIGDEPDVETPASNPLPAPEPETMGEDHQTSDTSLVFATGPVNETDAPRKDVSDPAATVDPADGSEESVGPGDREDDYSAAKAPSPAEDSDLEEPDEPELGVDEAAIEPSPRPLAAYDDEGRGPEPGISTAETPLKEEEPTPGEEASRIGPGEDGADGEIPGNETVGAEEAPAPGKSSSGGWKLYELLKSLGNRTGGGKTDLPPSADMTFPEMVELELERLDLGTVSFYSPRDMTVGVTAKVEAAVAKDVQEELALKIRERGAEESEVATLKVLVRSDLKGEGFRIQPLPMEDQPPNGIARWSWQVTPLKSGLHDLTLEVYVVAELADGAELRKDYPPAERRVGVDLSMKNVVLYIVHRVSDFTAV